MRKVPLEYFVIKLQQEGKLSKYHLGILQQLQDIKKLVDKYLKILDKLEVTIYGKIVSDCGIPELTWNDIVSMEEEIKKE